MANYNSSHTGAEIDSAIGRVKDTAVTAGTVSASLGVVVDANKDISGFRNVTLTGQLQAATINLTGDTTIGDGDTDNITINADVNSNIIPNTDNTFDLGSASKQWKDLYVNGIGYIDQLGTDADPIAIYASSGEIDGTAIGSESASTGAFTTISASGNVDFNGDLDVDGTTNLDDTDIDGTLTVDGARSGDFLTKLTSTNQYGLYVKTTGTTSSHDLLRLDDNSGTVFKVMATGATTVSGTLTSGAITQDSGVLTIKNASGDSSGLRIFQDSGDASKIYNNFNGTLQLGVGNTTALTIDSSERVGIGTNNPSDQLTISNSGEASVAIIGSAGVGGGDATLYLVENNTNFGIRMRYDGGDDRLYINADEDTRNLMTIERDGSGVGIGTTSILEPTYTQFEVKQSSDATGIALTSGNSNTDARNWGLFTNYSAWGSLDFRYSSGNNNTPRTNLALALTKDGDVGIGDTSPSNALTNFGSASRGLSIKNGQPTIALTDADTGSGALYIANGGGISYFQNTVSGATMRFYVESLQAFTINNDGESILRTNRGGTVFQVINDHSSIPYGMKIDFDNATPNNTNQYFITCQDSTNDKFIVNSNGDVKSRTNSYGAISDERLKENIVDATSKLDELNQVRIVNYNFKDDKKKQIGVIAQELQEIFPKMVDEYGEDKHLGVKYSIFVPMLIKALQEADDKIDALTARIEALEA